MDSRWWQIPLLDALEELEEPDVLEEPEELDPLAELEPCVLYSGSAIDENEYTLHKTLKTNQKHSFARRAQNYWNRSLYS